MAGKPEPIEFPPVKKDIVCEIEEALLLLQVAPDWLKLVEIRLEEIKKQAIASRGGKSA